MSFNPDFSGKFCNKEIEKHLFNQLKKFQSWLFWKILQHNRISNSDFSWNYRVSILTFLENFATWHSVMWILPNIHGFNPDFSGKFCNIKEEQEKQFISSSCFNPDFSGKFCNIFWNEVEYLPPFSGFNPDFSGKFCNT